MSSGKDTPRKRFQCKFCGVILPAWLPAAKCPNGAMLLAHLSQHHRKDVVNLAFHEFFERRHYIPGEPA
jgi:hypothetical protein